MNRTVVGLFAALHFAPTPQAAENLTRSSHRQGEIHITGNTVIDALLSISQRIDREPALAAELASQFPFLDPRKKLLLVTGHRRENFGDGFEQICAALAQLAQREDLQIVYPVHLNPNVQAPVQRWLAEVANVHLIAPQDYLPFVYLLKQAHIILTDSGGIQEEAPALGKPVLVMRDTTERPEAVAAGTAKLVGTQTATIVQAVSELLEQPAAYAAMAQAKNPYGSGDAAQQIVALIKAWSAAR